MQQNAARKWLVIVQGQQKGSAYSRAANELVVYVKKARRNETDFVTSKTVRHKKVKRVLFAMKLRHDDGEAVEGLRAYLRRVRQFVTDGYTATKIDACADTPSDAKPRGGAHRQTFVVCVICTATNT